MSTQRPLDGRVAIVTGGASGIGRVSALALSAAGAAIVIADRSTESGEEVAELVRTEGGRALFVETDVRSADSLERLTASCVDAFGQLDVMFNNAGITAGGQLLDWKPETYREVVAVNQEGVFYGIQAAARVMRDSGRGGVILNTGSVFGQLASWGTIGYQATKAAVEMMTKVAALELAPHGIRVVNVAPGIVDTSMVDPYREIGVIDAMARKHMHPALVRPEQIAQVVAFLATDAAECINGTTIYVDDGYSAFK